MEQNFNWIAIILLITTSFLLVWYIYTKIKAWRVNKLIQRITKSLHITSLKSVLDKIVLCRSRAAVDNYTKEKLFKENENLIKTALTCLADKQNLYDRITTFLKQNSFQNEAYYLSAEKILRQYQVELKPDVFRVYVKYTSPSGRSSCSKLIEIQKSYIEKLRDDPTLLMTEGQRNRFIKEQSKTALEDKKQKYYNRINEIIDFCNECKSKLVINDDVDKLDSLVDSLLGKAVALIGKIKTLDSGEWSILAAIIQDIEYDTQDIWQRNKNILDYYESDQFAKLKQTCDALTQSKKEFNEYINEKVNSITALFGTKTVRTETITNSEHKYIRPYKKSIDAFTAEVSQTIFANAENDPISYIIKYFYPDREKYPEQIQKLQTLIEELETLKDAKAIIDKYKEEYSTYIDDVPSYVLSFDSDGFYSRLGFADISENKLSVAYKFCYTSFGGLIQKSFTVPMTEDTIINLIEALQNKLTYASFAKEQRRLMTSKLRQFIKERDDFTCKYCSNSTYKEPNLLLEVDHIIPIAKGGITEENNLQTLCWKCNRHKSSK